MTRVCWQGHNSCPTYIYLHGYTCPSSCHWIYRLNQVFGKFLNDRHMHCFFLILHHPICFEQHISFNQFLHNDKNEIIKLPSWIKRVVSYSGDHLGLWASYLIFGCIVQTHIMNIMCNQQTRLPVIRHQFTWKPNWAHIWRLKKNSQINIHFFANKRVNFLTKKKFQVNAKVSW